MLVLGLRFFVTTLHFKFNSFDYFNISGTIFSLGRGCGCVPHKRVIFLFVTQMRASVLSF